MIIVMKPGAPMQECEKIKNGLINNGFQINEIVGVNITILGVIGDTSTLDINLLRVNDWVEKVMRVQEPFKRANRMFHPEDSIVEVNRRQKNRRYGRSMLGRDRRADHFRRQVGKAWWSRYAEGRSF